MVRLYRSDIRQVDLMMNVTQNEVHSRSGGTVEQVCAGDALNARPNQAEIADRLLVNCHLTG